SGYQLKIYVIEPKLTLLNDLLGNLPLIASLIILSIILPLLLMRALNHSFVTRLQELSTVFGRMTEDKLEQLPNVTGKDEIGSLMHNYNRMAARTNQLIQIVYKNKLKEQEMDIARQNAELLALHSQINPHFLFNALESIRMHSILKNEKETANMVEKLALMQRQYVEWGNDFVTIEQEMEFVKAYLGLQKYRFGDRLSYEIDVEEHLLPVKIPKLTVVTFVENACVHGIESKLTPGWVFVRAYQEKEILCLEIEDTGSGMEDSYRLQLIEKMKDANIAQLKEKGRVGIINACLRLKMLTKNQVDFELDGEEGAGTMVLIRIPLNYVR
ncbi:MAG: histidine kinase, partial [Clostridium sp.]|nr:histidine kinase [Clostridium sp.]